MFKKTVQNLEQCLWSEDILKEKGVFLEDISKKIKIPEVEDYKIYWIKTKQKPPSWLKFIEEHVKTGFEKKIINKTQSLLILLRVQVKKNQYRLFATSGGYGYHLINDYQLESNFGLKVALKTLSPDKIRQLDSIRPGVQTRQRREVTNISGRINTFDFECDAEILRTIAGSCKGNKLGNKISGSDSLKIVTSGTFKDIGEKCKLSFKTYSSNTKLPEGFEFIDYIQNIKEEDLLIKLNEKLAESIFNPDGEVPNLSFADPDMLDTNAFESFEINGGGSKEKLPDISTNTIKQYISKNHRIKDLDLKSQIEVLKKKIRITSYDESIGQPQSTKALYAYVSFETKYNDDTYVFNNKKWYKIDNDYFETVQNFISNQVTICKPNDLDPWYKQDDEGEFRHHETLYNSSYAENNNFFVLDKDFFRNRGIIGRSSIEIADLYHKRSKRLYCVKKYKKLSEFNHLLAQGHISAELMRKEILYREAFINKLNEDGNHNFEDKLCEDLTFVYALGSTDSNFSIESNLSFFAKLNLRKHIISIKALGFKTEVAYIEMREENYPS